MIFTTIILVINLNHVIKYNIINLPPANLPLSLRQVLIVNLFCH